MGTSRPRSIACALVALAFIAVVAPAVPASAKPKGKHHSFSFGSRSLDRGMKGKDVRFLQRALTKLGIATSVDGVFGKGTFKSVETLEQQHAWPVNGVVSRKDAKRIRKLITKHTASGSYFVEGLTSPTLTLQSQKAGTVKVKAVDSAGNVLQTFAVSFAGAESHDVAWNGTGPGGIAPDGIYQLRLADPGTTRATASGQTQPFALHLHAFPVPGPHNFGGPDARFGAPRSGHIHQGQDVPAACGQSELVDETGLVRVNAYQASGAGYYVVLHGALTGTDSVYMHLVAPSWAPVGASVYAGQQIGKVGATGDAQGCHLHFERWSAPGWFVGGTAYDPLPELLYWDTYS